MSLSAKEIQERRPVWSQLSELYLDTELNDAALKGIADAFRKSPYSLEEIRRIDKEEVFPVLYLNLMSAAGIWSGFDKAWLFQNIENRVDQKGFWRDLIPKAAYAALRRANEPYWKKIEAFYFQEER